MNGNQASYFNLGAPLPIGRHKPDGDVFVGSAEGNCTSNDPAVPSPLTSSDPEWPSVLVGPALHIATTTQTYSPGSLSPSTLHGGLGPGRSSIGGARGEGDIAPWLTDDFVPAMSGRDYPAPPRKTSEAATSRKLPFMSNTSSSSSSGTSRLPRQKSMNVPSNHSQFHLSSLTTIAASPPNSYEMPSIMSNNMARPPPATMHREGSHSSQLSTRGTSGKILRDRGRSASRSRQGSEDSGLTVSEVNERDLGYVDAVPGPSSGTVQASSHAPGGGRGGFGAGPASPSAGGPSATSGFYGRDARAGSQASLNSNSGQSSHLHDRKKGLSALTGLLKRKGPASGRPSTSGSDGGSRADHPAAASLAESPPRSSRVGSEQHGPTPYAIGPAAGISSRTVLSSPSMVSLNSMAYDRSDRSTIEHEASKDFEKGRNSLGRAFLTKARKASKKPAPLTQTSPRTRTPSEHAEVQGKMFDLDTDLNDMSGIIATPNNRSDAIDNAAGSMSSQPLLPGSVSADGKVSDTRRDTMGSWISSNSASQPPSIDDALGSSTGDKSGMFRRENPFSGSGDSASSSQFLNVMTPPSPHANVGKGSIAGNIRRPSQLRNVKTGSSGIEDMDDRFQSVSVGSGLGSIPTVFNEDPFGTCALADQTEVPGLSERKGITMRMNLGTLPRTDSLKVDPRDQELLSPGTGLQGFNLTPGNDMNAIQAAWTAPESWGVEGDQLPPEDDGSSEEVEVEDGSDLPLPPVNQASRAVHAFGTKSGDRRQTSRSDGQSKRPVTGGATRPGTSGSQHIAINHFIRIYNPDSTFTTLTLPLTATTQDVLSVLDRKIKEGKFQSQSSSGNIKLYIRERGQDRLLLPHERPLSIQLRRLLQAGYTDADRVDEMGRENLAMLCRFVCQPPILPIIDPEDEGSYESFELVDLGGRDLQAVPIFLYRHAHSIISLNLSRNPMTDLPLDFIQACTSLRELRMTHMALKRVPPSIRQSSAITRLDISCNRIVDLEHAGLHEISTLVSIKVQNNRLTTLPASFSELKSLKYLNISNNKFIEFPTVICGIHNLVDLDVSFNEINALPSELCKLASLERLVAVGNSLVTFPNSFSSLASLRELDVRRNSLTNLNAVYTLPNLAILQADYNNLVVLDAQLGPKVREFGMPHNSITRFTLAPLSTNATAYSLSVLDLSYAKLSTLADDALAQLVNLQTLNLNYNKFVRLPSTLENLENLRHLSCTDNVLTELPGGIGKLYNLQVLNVHNNNLKELPAGIWQCKDLRTLNASSNLLENFPETPFGMLDALAMPPGISRKDSSISQTDKQSGGLPLSKSLRNLMLCDNQLDEEVFESVSMLEELRVLNLSFNDIYEVPTWTISKNQRLEELYLSGNNLTSLPAEDLERLTSLRIIHINGNKLQTLPAELGKIHKLITLDVGSNVLKYNIANWPYDWNWNWNLELRYLNLSGNKRLEIKPSVQHDTGYNGAFRRDLSDFSKLSHIRVLGLMDVTLRIPSLPDESEQRRVRTSFSDLNGMGYGISDTLGRMDNLSMLDLVVPDFRSKDDECLFGMFGLAIPTLVGGRVPRFVQEWLASNFHAQLEKLKDTDTVADALRRTFLLVNKNCFDSLMAEENSRKDSSGNGNTNGGLLPSNGTYTPLSHQYRSGASGAVIYMTGRTLHVANAGRILAVISCKGEAELLSAKHDPFDKEETQRIRAAEAWVSPRGLVNDEVPLARGFGFYNAVPAVNSLPHVTKREITDADEFVIMANRALWDCCSYQTAVDIARTVKDNPMLAAQKLRDFAISYGAEGSIMIMVLSVADLFRQRPIRSRTMLMDKENAVDGEGYHAATKRVARRRIEDIGDRTLLRLQQEVEPPIGQVAMVFTDIKNSTSLWETNPGMQTAMRMHNSLLRRQLRIIGGYEVKTEGDAFIVSFPSVTSAILWCFTCQLQLLTEDWPREILECSDGREVFDSYGELIARGLSVRMGIHWGNPVWEKDPITRRMDYFGPMVNKSARVSASADGGQIMVSSDVHKEVQLFKTYLDAEDEDDLKELHDDVRRETIQLRKIGLGVLAMGEKKLKGLEVPEKMFLIYPRSLSGRLEMSAQISSDVDAHAPKIYGGEDRIVDLDDLRHLAQLCLRLEAVAAGYTEQVPSTSPQILQDQTSSQSPVLVKRLTNTQPILSLQLGPRISEEMSDDELVMVLASLTGRIENAISSLMLLRLEQYLPILSSLNPMPGLISGSSGVHSELAALLSLGKKDCPGKTIHHDQPCTKCR